MNEVCDGLVMPAWAGPAEWRVGCHCGRCSSQGEPELDLSWGFSEGSKELSSLSSQTSWYSSVVRE